MNPGDLIKIPNTAFGSVVFWFITEDNDVKACMIPGPVMVLYIGLWNEKNLNSLNTWHEILFDNRVFLVNINQMRKINI